MAWQPLEKGENNYDVIVIGAGISGINFGYRLQERNPHLSYCILEGRHELGGTWSLFNYPGIRSDSDLYTFGFPWRPWSATNAIAQGDLIWNYLKESAEMYGIDKKMKFNHQVDEAKYSSTTKSWELEVTANKSEKKTFKSRFMLLCTGYYDYHTPMKAEIPGIDNFKGQVIHPQFWPKDLDYTNKEVVVVGSGATAITILPVMAEKTKHITMLQRSPTYVLAVPAEDPTDNLLRKLFGWIPSVSHSLIRLKWVIMPLIMTTYSALAPKRARDLMHKLMSKQLPSSVPRDPHFTPKYYPWEQRMCMCPDGDFFKSLRKGTSSVVTGNIKNITEDTIQLQDGQELHPDIIVTATGLKLSFAGGMKVSVDNKPFDIPSKFVWKGVMIEDLPNAAFVIGYVDASWTLGADATAQMVTRILNKMKKEGAVEVIPRQSEWDRKNVKEANIMRLNSTYVQKGKDAVPKAGDRGQWVPRSNYFKDIMMAWFGDIKTGAEWVKA
ncbi:hypothetical protein CKM354_001230300 [Cercospora kikuchii]|uniref:Monooxygenase n=1 Tax=Cercospora kikuchii TaxID=84275 RepID=A0A9P3L0Y9_9PEZI|nr:uncharacterized protein CKM354_001230300 [Cercospora kikuchii]GIZ49271.1 hypothetical protein CKM354_001230300 [Cercospora kikuchii]